MGRRSEGREFQGGAGAGARGKIRTAHQRDQCRPARQQRPHRVPASAQTARHRGGHGVLLWLERLPAQGIHKGHARARLFRDAQQLAAAHVVRGAGRGHSIQHPRALRPSLERAGQTHTRPLARLRRPCPLVARSCEGFRRGVVRRRKGGAARGHGNAARREPCLFPNRPFPHQHRHAGDSHHRSCDRGDHACGGHAAPACGQTGGEAESPPRQRMRRTGGRGPTPAIAAHVRGGRRHHGKRRAFSAAALHPVADRQAGPGGRLPADRARRQCREPRGLV